MQVSELTHDDVQRIIQIIDEMGEDELAAGQFTVKRLADGDQRKLAEADLLEYLTKSRTA